VASKDDSVSRPPPLPEAHLEDEQFRALIDILRRNFLYQDPHCVYPKGQTGGDPEFLLLKIKPDHWRAMMLFINHAGGWTLPPDAARRIEVVTTIREARQKAHREIFGDVGDPIQFSVTGDDDD
jgi:hypothetical protein